MRPYRAVLPNPGIAKQADSRFDDAVLSDFDIGIDAGCLGINNGDAVAHQRFSFSGSQDALYLGEFDPVIDAKNLASVLNRKGDDSFAATVENLDEIS